MGSGTWLHFTRNNKDDNHPVQEYVHFVEGLPDSDDVETEEGFELSESWFGEMPTSFPSGRNLVHWRG